MAIKAVIIFILIFFRPDLILSVNYIYYDAGIKTYSTLKCPSSPDQTQEDWFYSETRQRVLNGCKISDTPIDRDRCKYPLRHFSFTADGLVVRNPELLPSLYWRCSSSEQLFRIVIIEQREIQDGKTVWLPCNLKFGKGWHLGWLFKKVDPSEVCMPYANGSKTCGFEPSNVYLEKETSSLIIKKPNVLKHSGIWTCISNPTYQYATSFTVIKNVTLGGPVTMYPGIQNLKAMEWAFYEDKTLYSLRCSFEIDATSKVSILRSPRGRATCGLLANQLSANVTTGSLTIPSVDARNHSGFWYIEKVDDFRQIPYRRYYIAGHNSTFVQPGSRVVLYAKSTGNAHRWIYRDSKDNDCLISIKDYPYRPVLLNCPISRSTIRRNHTDSTLVIEPFNASAHSGVWNLIPVTYELKGYVLPENNVTIKESRRNGNLILECEVHNYYPPVCSSNGHSCVNSADNFLRWYQSSSGEITPLDRVHQILTNEKHSNGLFTAKNTLTLSASAFDELDQELNFYYKCVYYNYVNFTTSSAFPKSQSKQSTGSEYFTTIEILGFVLGTAFAVLLISSLVGVYLKKKTNVFPAPSASVHDKE